MKIFTILLMSLFWLGANATSWRVNNNPAIDADFTTFEAAVAGASAGDTLYMEGSNFTYGECTLTKPLVIIGPGYYLTENDSTQVSNLEANFESFYIDSTASGSQIYGCHFDDNVRISGSNVIFARNWIYGESGYGQGIYVGHDNDVVNCSIIQNFCNNIEGGYYSYDPVAHNTLIANNIIYGSIDFNSNATNVIYNNVVHTKISVYNSIVKNNIQYASGYGTFGFVENEGIIFEYNMTIEATPPPGTGNIANIDPVEIFADYEETLGFSTDGKWQLKEGSPAIGAGENGTDCGAFGGTSPYILSGLPAVPHIYEALVPTSGSAASGLPVTIKVKSQN
jgi:hypothetical protein